MTTHTTRRRADAQRTKLARRAAQDLGRTRVRFDVTVRGPVAATDTDARASTTARLWPILRAVVERVALATVADPDSAEGTAVTITALVPRQTAPTRITWDAVQLSQLLYSDGRWMQSVNGRDWTETPHAGPVHTPAPALPAETSPGAFDAAHAAACEARRAD